MFIIGTPLTVFSPIPQSYFNQITRVKVLLFIGVLTLRYPLTRSHLCVVESQSIFVHAKYKFDPKTKVVAEIP